LETTHTKTKTISNVFRKWRVDSSEDIDLAVHNDVKSADFQPELFMKDADDIAQALVVIKNNFKTI